MFRVTRNLLGYSQKNLPVGDLFLRSRTIKMVTTQSFFVGAAKF